MKRTRVILGLLLVAVLMMGITFSTYAYFTDEAASKSNVFDTATLNIAGTGGNHAVANMKLENIWPGPEGSKTGTIEIKNIGTMDLKYKVSSEMINGSEDLYSKLYVKITKPSGAVAYEGRLDDLSNYLMNGNLPVGKAEKLTFEMTLDRAADDELQDKKIYVRFVFDATQWDNPERNWSKEYAFIAPGKVVREGEGNYDVFEKRALFENGDSNVNKDGYGILVYIDKPFKDNDFKAFEISIYDRYDRLLKKMIGTSKLLNELSTPACYASFTKDDSYFYGDDYWMMGSWQLDNPPTPSYAIVRATLPNGDIHELKTGYTGTND